MTPFCVVMVVVSAKHASELPGPHAAQHIPNKTGFQATEEHAATQAVHAPGANGPDLAPISNRATKNVTSIVVLILI